MTIKQQLFDQCLEAINNRILKVQLAIEDIHESLESETKNTSGDKHETGRAMLQIERENAGKQLFEFERQKEILKKINPKVRTEQIVFGSVVKTTQQHYFVSISAGQLTVEENVYYAISVEAPIAQILLGKKNGDIITFGSNTFTITAIY